MEGASGAAEAGGVLDGENHQPLDTSDGSGGLRLVACARAGAATSDDVGRQGAPEEGTSREIEVLDRGGDGH